ncbi:hypothetical protein [Dinghuibacter silviterrae]|uniref:Glycosyl hydrolase family 38 n=1 Tax=Dinghuibacter silviterrae TaxID=1539049 RepID=A0A4V3GKJ7_9BACT|nr:hypothetical protein [Dinghuibacter silviterrae]TDW95912.1 glycosyl hydrolase family 38 [Dinghuibacter silviterrae]
MKIWIAACVFACSLPCSAQEKVDTSVREIILVFKSHLDVGYSDYAEGVLQKYTGGNVVDALDLIDKTGKRFVWTTPGWEMKEMLERAQPGTKIRLEAALRSGNLALNALPFNIETEACDPEMLVRGLGVSSALSREYGLPLPRDAKQTDVPSHSWILPTLLTNAGVRFLHIGCNYSSGPPEVPLLFWWEGPDGSRLMTMYYAPAYGTQLLPTVGWPFKTWLALMVKNDNEPPPSQKELDALIARAHRLAPNARIRIGRISDFYDDIMKEHPSLPVVRGDMPDTWIHGYMSMPREVKGSRNTSRDLFAWESLDALSSLWMRRTRDITGALSGAYLNDLLFDEHTFGLSMSYKQNGVWGYGDAFKLNRAEGMYDDIERSWHEKGDREFDAEKIVVPSMKRQMQQLALNIDVSGKRILVYNELPWSRDGVVTVKESSPGSAVKDLRTGEVIPVSNEDNIIRFTAKNVPPMGYACYTLQAENATPAHDNMRIDTATASIENNYVVVRFDTAHGCIRSILDKKTGSDMVDTTQGYGFGQYLYERYSKKDADDYCLAYSKPYGTHPSDAEFARPFLPEGAHVSVAGGAARMFFSRDAAGLHASMMISKPHDYVITVTLPEDSTGIELTWSINGKPADPWPEAGWLCFPFNVKQPVFKLGRLGAIVDPSKGFIKGSNMDYGFLNTGMAVLDSGDQGFGLCSPEAPGISLGTPGLWKYSREFGSRKPVVFVNLYNNLWGTNFTEWVEGSWSVRMKLWRVGAFDNERSIITPSAEFRSPLRAVLVEGPKGPLPASAPGIRLSMKGVMVTAFGQNPDGNGTLLRLWEEAGRSGKCTVQLPAGFTSAQFCDLRGEPVSKPFPLVNGQMELAIEANRPLSIILK